jgi:uncharacterized protein YidB (DUF937 family)
MGLMDGVLSQVLGAAMGGGGGGGGNNPLGSILNSVSSSLGGPGGASAAGGGLGGLAGLARGALGGGSAPAGGGGAGSALGTGAILAAVMALVQSQGGLSGLLTKLRASGLGAHADSWVGTGANQPVSADELHKALGGGAIGSVASQLGIDTQQAGGLLSKVLPELVNQMSPSGALPDNHGDLMSKGLEMLRGLSR